ncbi:MAG TPA: XRE family transcriptional regulator [Sphingobacteriaceae bacterium]|nr:XRE family transcriptional regulator [Sphingobacteriaceae bacterium]
MLDHSRDKELIIAFGKRIRKLRTEKGISTEKLSVLAGIDYRHLSNVELGNVNTTISTASLIAKGLKIELKDLFDF